ncbi:MAG TPA: Crp/Fnr family transcriptional regulator [Bacteroidales bacterium]|nr:Crp/Fnr family transcriptional regulator [Bacteroidales bacterium]
MSDVNLVDNCENCTKIWKNFSFLSGEELHLIDDNKYEATFKPGEIMIKQGSPTSNALFLASGMAKTYIEGNNGRNFILNIALPGQLIIGPGAYTNSRHTFSVAALTTVQACFINFDVFRKLMKSNGDFAESLLEDISTKSLRAHSRMVNQAQKRMPGRLADALIYFADEVFNADEYDMILSRQELGEMANMAKECVVRILKELEELGVINSGSSRIKIIDKERLIQISEKG